MYAIWFACERFGLLPPDVKQSWNDNTIWTQALLISYSQIREYEHQQEVVGKWQL